MSQDFLSPIEEIIEDARNGKMYILVDDEDRENEGDLIIPAQMATPDAVNFMAKHGRGLICLTMTDDRVRELGLPLMSQANSGRHKTAFTVSIEAREGVTTGISAGDRAKTINVAIDPNKGATDIATPGHVFPLAARDGGVLVRAGHTEASVDISKLAGLNASAVICEIMNDDGTMARMDDLIPFAQLHGLKVGTIRDLIAYRLRHDHVIERAVETDFVRESGHIWHSVAYQSLADHSEAVALIYGDPAQGDKCLVRMHVHNPFEDLYGEKTQRSGQLARAMEVIEEEGRGVVVVFSGEYAAKPSVVITARNQGGEKQADKQERVVRNIGYGAQIMIDLGVKHLVLLSNSPTNVIGLDGYGIDIVEQRNIPE